MRVKIKFAGEIILPIYYNYLLSSVVYNIFSEPISNFLHKTGFVKDNRHYKLFTFSKPSKGNLVEGKRLEYLKNKLKIENKKFTVKDRERAIYFSNGFYIQFSSPINFIYNDFSLNSIKRKEINIIGQRTFISEVSVVKPPTFKKEMILKTISPIVVYYSSMHSSRHNYIMPGKNGLIKFNEYINKNLQRKYKIINQQSITDLNKKIELYPVYWKKNVTYYKGGRIEGSEGQFIIKGDPELIQLSYDAGLGVKNSSGFGMWEAM